MTSPWTTEGSPPIGVKHEVDRSGAAGDYMGPDPNGPPSPSPARRGRKAFSVSNGNASAVFQRSASDFRVGLIVVSSFDPAQVVGRRPGRVSTMLWVPSQVYVAGVQTSVTNGVMFANDKGELQNGAGAILNVGDSIEIPSEATVYVASINGAGSPLVGYVQWADLFNSPDNEPGT